MEMEREIESQKSEIRLGFNKNEGEYVEEWIENSERKPENDELGGVCGRMDRE
jgi:hypothetical protein